MIRTVLEAATAAADSTASSSGGFATSQWVSLVLMVVLLVVLYFVMIRPQKKQEKEVARMRDSLAVGDEVTTIGGIIGKVISIKDETVMIESGHDRTKIRILRSAVKTVDVKAEDAAQ